MSALMLVRWVDSIRHADGWQTIEHYKRQAEGSMECETVGWEIHETDDSVMVAQSRMTEEGGSVTEVIRIPKVAISERVFLAETKRQA